MSDSNVYDVIIIGSGPAGLTAAIYTSRARLKTLVIGGTVWGGQLMITTEVENFPGFPKGILGPELMEKMREQAEKFGSEIIFEDATKVDFSSKPFIVTTSSRVVQAKAVIVATGASAKWLGLESEKRLQGMGISGCATCDGPFYKDMNTVVVGGGDSAMEEALFLTRFAKTVKVIHRRDQLRATKILQERAMKNEKIEFVWDSVVDEILGDDKVTRIRIKNLKTGEKSEIPTDGVFIAIGHKPNTDLFKGQLDMDGRGYVKVIDETKTNIKGVFVAGDVHDYTYRQAATAAGSGCKAAIDAERYLSE